MRRVPTARVGRVGAAVVATLFAMAILAPVAHAQNAGQDVDTDCTCECAASASVEATTTHIAVGSEAACTDAKCINEVAACTSIGTVKATYHDCSCHCCNVGLCQFGLGVYPFKAGSPERCSASSCASEFFQCPNDPNEKIDTPAAASFTWATYQDCTCGCCNDPPCTATNLVYKMFYAGSENKCTPDACASKFYVCPNSGAHSAGSRVEATYNGVEPPPPSPSAATTGGGVTVTPESTELPTYAAALIGILVIVLVGAVIGIFVHRKIQAERGFRWVKFDEHDHKPDESGARV
jgi:hypothetical protein